MYQKGGASLKEFLKKMKKNWITVWLVVVIFACSALVTYAAYTRINIVKRVVSTDAGAGARFSSDSMNSSDAGMIVRKSFSSQTDDALVDVHVFNYPYPKASLYRNVATDYNVVSRIGTHDGTTFTPLSGEALTNLSNDYYISYNDGAHKLYNATSGTVTYSNCRLGAGKVDPDLFSVHFSNAELSDNPPGYCVEIVATPEDTSLPVLKGYIFVRYSKVIESGWTGALEELSSDKDYDGYNYILEGSGAGRITFKWNPTYLNINKQFLHNPENAFYINGAVVDGNDSLSDSSFPTVDGMKSITLVVDSQEKKNRYVVQFYKTDSNNPNYDYQNSAIASYLPDSSDWEETDGGN